MYPKTICPVCNQTWSRVQLCIVRSERERSEREKDNTIRNNHFCYTLNKPSVDWHSTFQLVTRVRPYDAASEKSIEFKHESVAWNLCVSSQTPPTPSYFEISTCTMSIAICIAGICGRARVAFWWSPVLERKAIIIISQKRLTNSSACLFLDWFYKQEI